MKEEKESTPKLYDELSFFDVLGSIRHYLDRGVYSINTEGLIERKINISHQSPWLFARHDDERKCALWAQVMFSDYKIISSGCMNCWKVTCSPRNLKEAFAILELQKEIKLGDSAKTGMEQRTYTGKMGGWSSFWYASLKDGLEGGRKLFVEVKKAMSARFECPPKVTLKRGCTEMERAAGPSDKWEYGVGTELKEQMIDAVYAPMEQPKHPRFLEVYIQKQWIEWAATYGDKTYLEFVSTPLLSEIVTYNNSVHSDKDFESIKQEGRKENAGDKKSNCNGCEDCSCKSDKAGSGLILV